MKIPANYRRPVLIAILFHAILLCVLIFNFAPEMFRMPPASAPTATIHATAISQNTVQTEVHRIDQARAQVIHQKIQAKDEELEREKQWAQHVQKIQTEEKKARAKAILQQQKLAQLRIKNAAIEKQKAIEQKELAQKLAQEKAQKIKLAAKQARLAAANKLLVEQKKLQQEIMQQQMSSEQKNLSAVVSQAQQGAINKYKAQILALIQSNWRIDQVNDQLKCVYDVSVAPDGTILSATLKQSSGNSDLDESAEQAIMASSPLPVPKDPTLFNHFRLLVLTLSPQGFLVASS